jgi:4-amino-4-deoxy-L-arabinose transferase-like glycosyltransferase
VPTVITCGGPSEGRLSLIGQQAAIATDTHGPRLRAIAGALAAPAAVAGFALIVAAQAMIGRDFDSSLGVIGGAARYLRDVYESPRTVLAAAILLAVGGALFAIGMRRWPDIAAPFLPDAGENTGTASRHLPALIAAIACAALGVVLVVYVNRELLNDDYRPRLVWLFAISLVAFAGAIFAGRWSAGAHVPFRFRWWEPLLVAAAVTFFLVVNIRDLDSWRYAAIGDEYAHFDYSKAIENESLKPNFFTQLGVYDYRPVGTSVVQATTMRIFGADSFGFRLATPIALAIAIPAVYLLGRELFNRAVAAFATLIFAVSHYLISYAHTVYDNPFGLVPFTWCLALAVMGLRRTSPMLMFVAGVVGGLGFYTFPQARMGPLVLLLLLATLGPRAWKPSLILPLAVGGLATTLPMFSSDGWDAISSSRDRTVFGFTDSASEGIGIRIAENVPRTLLAFNFNPNPGHFVSGSLFDPVAAVLLVAGLAYAISRILQPAYRLLVLWLAVALLFAGIFSPYDRVAYDRLHLALPVLALFSGVAAGAIATRLGATLSRFGTAGATTSAGYLALGAFIALTPLLAYLNLHRFLVESPDKVPWTEERLVLGGIQHGACDGHALAVMGEPRPLLNPAIEAYGFDREIVTRSHVDAVGMDDYQDFDCIVVTQLPSQATTATGDETGDAAATGASLVRRLEQQYGFEQRATISHPLVAPDAVVLTQTE